MNLLRQVLVVTTADCKFGYTVNWRLPQNAENHMPDHSVLRGPCDSLDIAEREARAVYEKIGATAFDHIQAKGTWEQASQFVWQRYGGREPDTGGAFISMCEHELI